jgi:hypothetical protein
MIHEIFDEEIIESEDKRLNSYKNIEDRKERKELRKKSERGSQREATHIKGGGRPKEA